jgi:hypothetical protein
MFAFVVVRCYHAPGSARKEGDGMGNRVRTNVTSSQPGLSATEMRAVPRTSTRTGSPPPRTRSEFEAAKLRSLIERSSKGAPVREAASVPRYCVRCRKQSEGPARFCDRCGARLPAAAQPVSAFTDAVRAAIERDRRASASRHAMKEATYRAETFDLPRCGPNASMLLPEPRSTAG